MEFPIWDHADVCVVGGSATGVFAAVRAARMGAKVILLEQQNVLGGTATAGMVNIWHTLNDVDQKEQIIFGLTDEVERRLEAQGALERRDTPDIGCRFNSARLSCLLDDLVAGCGIRVYLRTTFVWAQTEGDEIKEIIITNKDGVGRIRAGFFIDATGDGDVADRIGLESYCHAHLQPPSACFLMQGMTDGVDIGKLIHEHGAEFGLDDDWGWSGTVPGLNGISFRADNHVFGVNCAKAGDLTRAEIRGRQQARAFVDLLRQYVDPSYEMVALCSAIGIRDTRHIRTRFCATEQDLLCGKTYPDTVMRGTYRVDIHHQTDNGITFKYLNGQYETFYGKGSGSVRGNWREEMGLSGKYASCYSVPFSILVQEKYRNFIPVGRMLNADEGAFGALRVMVNLNQLGEAAGVAAALCVGDGTDVRVLDGVAVRRCLEAQNERS